MGNNSGKRRSALWAHSVPRNFLHTSLDEITVLGAGRGDARQ